MMDAELLGEDLLAERRDLLGLLAALDDGQWYTRTPFDDWVVMDHVTHLAYFDDLLRLAIDDSHGAWPMPIFHPPDARPHRAAVAAEYRTLRPRAALSWLREAGRTLVASAIRARAGSPLPAAKGDASLSRHLKNRIFETWAHGQDVYDGLRIQRPWTPRLHHVAGLGLSALTLELGHKSQLSTIRLELDGWVQGPIDTSNRITGTLEDFCLLTTGRRLLKETDLVATGEVADLFLKTHGGARDPSGGVCIPQTAANRTCRPGPTASHQRPIK